MAQNTLPLTHIQRLIGERMLSSKLSKPCFYIESKADVTDLMAMRNELGKRFGVKITTNSFYVRAVGIGAAKYPLMVGRIEGGKIKVAESINVGFAVTAPQGLVVPVMKGVDKLSLAEIARCEKLLTEKGRSNKLTLKEMEGETIAVSNLGAYDIDSFIGIVPQPASAILAVGNALPTVVVKDGEVVTRRIVSLTLAVDGRIIAADYAAKFLRFITEELSNPKELV